MSKGDGAMIWTDAELERARWRGFLLGLTLGILGMTIGWVAHEVSSVSAPHPAASHIHPASEVDAR